MVLYIQPNFQLLLQISIWDYAGLNYNNIVFPLSFPLFLLIYYSFSTKSIIFFRPAPYFIVFALVYVQFDKRKPVARYFKLNRLLYFIRAVHLALSTGNCIKSERAENLSGNKQTVQLIAHRF